MKIKLVVIFVLFLNSKIFSQDIYYKVEYGKGSGTASDVYLQIKLDYFLVEIEAKRLKSTIRDMDMEISTNIDGYDYYNDYIKLLLDVMSATADGLTIKIGENSEYVTTEIKKMSYSLNDWDLFLIFFLDNNLTQDEQINFHPLENTATITMQVKDFINFLLENNKKVNIFDFKSYTLIK